MSDMLTVERRGNGVVWLRLQRPEARNALSRALNLQIAQVVTELGYDPQVRAVVIRGSGDKAFCAGADLKERKDVAAEDTPPYVAAIATAINQVANLRVPTIAAMNGSAYGGGLELALACDFRILVEGAEVGLTEVKLGIMPGAGGTVRLPRLVGEARAKELILLGRRIPAARAYEIGLVNRVVPLAQLDGAVDELLAELAAAAPLSVRCAKTAIERGMETSVDAALELEYEQYRVTLFSDDRNEGLRAFAEGRPPQFQGQ